MAKYDEASNLSTVVVMIKCESTKSMKALAKKAMSRKSLHNSFSKKCKQIEIKQLLIWTSDLPQQ